MKSSISITSILAIAAFVAGTPVDHGSLAKRAAAPPFNTALTNWVNSETTYAKNGVLANISPSGASAGSVQAAPSTSNPDYRYHWVRDAGITLHEVSGWLNATSDSSAAAVYNKKLADYATFSRTIQTVSSPSGLGTAKFYMDGTAYTGPWCNPQRDGAAMRAVSLISYARYLKSQGKDVTQYYDGKSPTSSVIKADLEYVANNWNADSQGCDIWEEVRGNHFYTRMIQRRAMIEGAQFANQMGDPGAAAWYNTQATAITNGMDAFWSGSIILPTINYNGGVSKPSNIDAQVFLAVLHASLEDGFYTVDSDRVLATIVQHIAKFNSMYAINTATTTTIASTSVPVGPALGRYPEDTYNGYESGQQGNPWTLITSGMAECHYRLISTWSKNGKIVVTQAVANFLNQLTSLYGITFSNSYSVGSTYGSGSATFNEILANTMLGGDRYMARVARHTDANGKMWEEWNLSTGFGQGAPDLTWSYGAHVSAATSRAAASKIVYGA
ncbi:Six-hairpin glycosidase [Linderina pennispora]|uniref:glucan 1,4-alpha-glucosidase n=1 Tax=Linderina pennispora TaxID=61395 RepID=A0A1Y1W5F0_9FUNG|nr:Six-hairpin glycosidase [Linderina pennispora]ORX68759.1 Six-hairpin glycosidase [Linderina pennispora]